MILLKKKITNGYFDFEEILRNGYVVDEQPNVISKKQYANGNRKKIITNYTDVTISIKLGILDAATFQNYKNNLVDGEYQYYSVNDNQMKSANFIITMPSIEVESSVNSNVDLSDFTITLEKSSDVS